jgi:isopenicillin N synthase-like dioxygenase
MSDAIPVIDVARFLSQNDSDRAHAVEQARRALEEVGFLRIAGHGVPESLIARVERAALTFFDKPEDEKMRHRNPSRLGGGYGALRSRAVGIAHDPTLLKSLVESFGFSQRELAGDRLSAGAIWPASPADFEPAMRVYHTHMGRLFGVIMRMFAIALDLPEGYFEPMLTHGDHSVRLAHYPALDSEPLPGEQRAGAHTDTGALTILHIDDTPDSLQVQTRSKKWIFVNRTPGTFVVNTGDIMMRWTNDKWVSTFHRVVNPPLVDGRAERRLSIACFCNVNSDTMIEALPGCADADNPARYAPVTSGDYRADRSAVRFGLKAPTAADHV